MERCKHLIEAVDVWRVDLQQRSDVVASLEEKLSEAESVRRSRFVSVIHRERFTVAHGALRVILAQYLESHEAVKFYFGEDGKPQVASESGLVFSLSHSLETAVIAVSSGRRIGVDVEWVGQRRGRQFQFLHQILSGRERNRIAELVPEERYRGLLTHWVCKEACLKARGNGVRIPLDSLSVDAAIDASRQWLTVTDVEGDDWLVQLLDLGDSYVGALVTEGTPTALTYRQWAPDAIAR